MRVTPTTDGRSHIPTIRGTNDHHPQPAALPFSNTSQSLPPGTDYDLQVSLPDANFKGAIVTMMGLATASGVWRECAQVVVTTDLNEAQAYSSRDAGDKRVYTATYSKQNGDANLTFKIFDNNPASGNRYIALKDAWISGAVLYLRFHNYYGGSSTLWVKGLAEVY